MSSTPQRPPEPFQPMAAILAFAFPGAGHVYLGQTHRGVLASIGVLFLFLGGIFVGGITCIDRREDFPWFLGQALCGPITFAADYVHQNKFKVIDPPTGVIRSARPTEYRDPKTGKPVPISIDASGKTSAVLSDGTTVSPAYPPAIKGVGRMRELGTLFTTIAGFMNLICILDAAFNRRSAPVTKGGASGKVYGNLEPGR